MHATLGASLLFLLLTFAGDVHHDGPARQDLPGVASRDTCRVTLLAVGDINLGRRAGKILLGGDTLYPFMKVAAEFARHDIVFANLECPVSEQGGQTEHPRYNMIFTAPPVAAWSLQRGGVTVVSTANNHAFDYGASASRETLRWLDSVGIAHAGSAAVPGDVYRPAVIVRNGIKIALFAVTDFMNSSPRGWEGVIARADTGKLFPCLRVWQDSADFRILSYHGGDEYTDRSPERVRAFMRAAVDAGANLVLGHHPHVPHGLERRGSAWIAHSLGNFVFRQPGKFWAEHAIALSITVEKADSVCRVGRIRVLPVACDFQPSWLAPGPEFDKVRARISALSTEGVEEFVQW
jgi:poly-gamma-glutamate capsule biosynthesis protein CapA/YwtB (metallophosphatase superfamily)